MHQNCGSVGNKVLALQGVVETYTPHVLILSETWLSSDNVKNLVVNGYTHANYYVRKNRIHGGVSIFVKSNLKCKRIPSIDKLTIDYECELVAVEINTPSDSIWIIGMYRTGLGNFLIMVDVLRRLFELLCSVEKRKVILMGDWNVDFLLNIPNKKTLINLMLSSGFRNVVNFPTRIKNGSATSIDCVVTNIQSHDINVKSLATALSDHDAQIAGVRLLKRPQNKYKFIERRSFDNEKVEAFTNAILSYEWDKLFNNYDNDSYNKFMNKILWNLDIYFPAQLKRIKSNQRCPWINDKIIKIQNDINDLYVMQRQYPEIVSESGLISKKIIYRNNLIQSEKIGYIQNRIQNSKNPKKEVWNIIKEDTNKAIREWEWDLRENSSKKPIETEKVADYINDYFISIGTDLQKTNQPKFEDSITFLNKYVSKQNELHFQCISHDSLQKLVKKKIDNSDTKDLYDLSGTFVYKMMDNLFDHIHYLVNNVLTSDFYPTILKKVRLTPLYKGKGEKSNVQNYRPIAIVPTLSKITESIMSDAILKHLTNNNNLSNCQHAYRPGRSTISATQRFVERVIDHLEDKKKVAGVFLDLSKAFDSVNHELLLEKLKVYGLTGTSLDLVKSFLEEREQTVEVKIEGKRFRSTPRSCKIGVPQGSSLGNTLFLVFLNDIAYINIKGDIIQYADDTTIILSAESGEELLDLIRDTIATVSTWFEMNGLKLNADKTNVIVFNAVSPRQSSNCPIQLINGSTIVTSDMVKLLGLELDPVLSWKHHIDSTCKKMARGIYALKQLRPISSEKSLKEVYYAYIHSIMSYGIILWGCSSDYERVLKLQKRAVRVLMRAEFRESCRDHFKNLKILTSVSVYILEIIKYVRVNLSEYTIRGKNNKRSIRNKMILDPIDHRLNMCTKLPKLMGQQLYNRLPLNLKLIKSEDKFFQETRKLLLDKTLYSIKEFLQNDYSLFKVDVELPILN